MNLPAMQRIAMEFERENDMMDQRQEMMDDAIDDTFEDEEEESDEIVNQVLDEIGVDLSQSVCCLFYYVCVKVQLGETPQSALNKQLDTIERMPQAVGADDDLQARLDSLRKQKMREGASGQCSIWSLKRSVYLVQRCTVEDTMSNTI